MKMTSGKYLAGVALIVVGLGFLLQQTGLWNFGDFLSTWWPLGIILVGVFQFSKKTISPVAGITIIAVGVILQLRRFDFIPAGFKNAFWPIILIVIGVAIVYSKTRDSDALVPEESDDFLKHFVAFAGLETRNNSLNFQGGSVTALFGGAEIDLSNSKMVNDSALELNAIFGGVDIKVPKEWKVIASGLPLFGGWDNKTTVNTTDLQQAPVLKVKCFAMFGGIEIKN
jgi:hypothetical protein